MTDAKERVAKYILVVDDEKDVAHYHAAILEDAGFETAIATSGDGALEMVKERSPDLISLDLVMPDKGGMRFLYALRKKTKWANIPVIIVTGHAHDDLGRGDLEEILSGRKVTGPQVCMEKPVRPADYVAAVSERLGLATGVAPSLPTLPSGTRQQIADLLGDADPETLKEVLRLLQQKRAALPSGERPGGARVLIIDDEPDVASYLAAILSDADFVTSTASDPMTAHAIAKVSRPDVITMDLNMPGKTGQQLFRELMSDEDLRGIPVIVITALEEDHESELRGQKGIPDIVEYIRKPIRPDVLVGAVKKALKSTFR
jgi:CheY-like chemotaxis protein